MFFLWPKLVSLYLFFPENVPSKKNCSTKNGPQHPSKTLKSLHEDQSLQRREMRLFLISDDHFADMHFANSRLYHNWVDFIAKLILSPAEGMQQNIFLRGCVNLPSTYSKLNYIAIPSWGFSDIVSLFMFLPNPKLGKMKHTVYKSSPTWYIIPFTSHLSTCILQGCEICATLSTTKNNRPLETIFDAFLKHVMVFVAIYDWTSLFAIFFGTCHTYCWWFGNPKQPPGMYKT